VSYSTYAYDAQGRVASSELAGGAERLTFVYSAPGSFGYVYDASGSARSYSFVNSAGVLRPSAVSAPCPSCGSTQKSTVYDAALQPTKEIAHDGSVAFVAYDAKGRETERATFASSYASSTTRPALNLASRVVSTQWHATFNLPTQAAEPNKTTANTYNAKGLLTSQSWTATTDATGAAKFTAVKTGSTYATTWSYSASSLATTIVTKETAAGATVATETGRWTAAYNTTGDMTAETRKYASANPPRADETTRYSAFRADGTAQNVVTANGKTATLIFTPRGAVREIAVASTGVPSQRTQFLYGPTNRPQEVQLPDASKVRFEFNTLGRLNAVSDSSGGRFEYTFASDGSIQSRLDTGNAAALTSRVLASYDPLGWAIAGAALPTSAALASSLALQSGVTAAAATQEASVADALALSTSKQKRAACIAACVAAGTYAGAAGGRYVGGATLGVAGTALGTALPGVGNVVLGTAGAVAGGAGGSRAGAWAGSLAGAAAAAAICPSEEDECDLQRRVDEDRCVAEAGARYGRRGVAICQHSAMQRYAECLRFGRGGIRTPLAGVDTPL
jgi:YD repeat-containing protein